MVNDYPIQSPGQLSSHLRALRKVRGLSQAQLGALLGVGQTRVARIERDPTTLEQLAREELGWVRDGDLVIVLPDEHGSSDSADPAKMAAGRVP